MDIALGSALDPVHAVLTVSGETFEPAVALAGRSVKADYIWLKGETRPWGRKNRQSGCAVTAYSGDVFEFAEGLHHFFEFHEGMLQEVQLPGVRVWLTISLRLDFHAGVASVLCLNPTLMRNLARFDVELIVNASSKRLVQRNFGLTPDEDEPGPFEELEAYVEEVAGVESTSGYLTNVRSQGAPVDDRLIRAWGGLLDSLGWELQEWSAPASSVGLGLRTWSDRLQRDVPLVFAPFAYVPGDDTDALVEETKAALSAQYPDGVLLGFETLMFKEIDGFRYTFGGLIFFHNQWRPFAISRAANSFDALLAQRESGFSFHRPLRGHEDDGGQLATGFNLLVQGGDPELPWRVVYLHQGEWRVPMLA